MLRSYTNSFGEYGQTAAAMTVMTQLGAVPLALLGVFVVLSGLSFLQVWLSFVVLSGGSWLGLSFVGF